MEQAALSENTIYLNGGQRGLQIEIAPEAARAALDAMAATLTD
jgi:Cys-tRNA(Pro)/Cys-tRNA(Cys) deacylase